MKAEVLAAYGGAKCVRCGSTEDLHIDHINGGGNKHRMEIFGRNSAGYSFWAWLKRNGWPAGYQVLCKVCNCYHKPKFHWRAEN